MNTNNNLYTILYSATIVVVVAAILAFTAESLKPRQEANEKAETISQMLTAAQLSSKSDLEKLSNDQILKKYSETIKEAFLINKDGDKVDSLNTGKEGINKIEVANNLKLENSYIKKGDSSQVKLPVYIFNKDGKDITVVPIYGAGLWGPVWGYIAFNNDLNSIVGAYFDHESETPGLGAKIKDEPWFREQFVGKTVDFSKSEKLFEIVKGGAPKGQDNAIDAITGATLTSNGLNGAINTWMEAYKPYFVYQQELIKQKNGETCYTNYANTDDTKSNDSNK